MKQERREDDQKDLKHKNRAFLYFEALCGLGSARLSLPFMPELRSIFFLTHGLLCHFEEDSQNGENSHEDRLSS